MPPAAFEVAGGAGRSEPGSRVGQDNSSDLDNVYAGGGTPCIACATCRCLLAWLSRGCDGQWETWRLCRTNRHPPYGSKEWHPLGAGWQRHSVTDLVALLSPHLLTCHSTAAKTIAAARLLVALSPDGDIRALLDTGLVTLEET